MQEKIENEMQDETEKEINILRWLLVSAGIIIAIIIATYGYLNNRVNYDNLEEVRIRISGTMIPSGSEYALYKQHGKWIASYEKFEWLESFVFTEVVNDAYANGIIKTLNKNKAHRWDKFNLKFELEKRLNGIATDGTYYSFYMRFSDGTEINIKEYNIYPEGYMTVYNKFKSKWNNSEKNN